jgi:putative oxidoreductase
MTDSRTAPYASLLLRLALGILFLAHFSLKFCFYPGGYREVFCLSVCPAGWPISPWRLNWWGRLR